MFAKSSFLCCIIIENDISETVRWKGIKVKLFQYSATAYRPLPAIFPKLTGSILHTVPVIRRIIF